MSSNVKRFILLGESGAGKSAFVNTFYNYCYGTRSLDAIFGEDQNKVQLAIPCKDWLDRIQADEKSSERDINDQSKSQTRICTSYTLRFDNVIIELIDTPGLNDSNGVIEDDIILTEIEKILKTISYLNGIIIIANGSVARLGTSFLHFMQTLHQIWPNNLMKNMCTILTNCDGTSCNLSSEVLCTKLKVDKAAIFYLQNSLFGWNRQIRTSKTIRNLRRDFEDAIDLLEKFLPFLIQFEQISTNTFKMSSMIQNDIQDCVATSIHQMVELLKVNRRQQVIAEGLNGARVTMAANTKWHTKANITAFKWMEVEPTSQRSFSSTKDSFICHDDSRMTLPLHKSDNSQYHASNHAGLQTNDVPINLGVDAKVFSDYALDTKRPDLQGHTDVTAPSLRTVHDERASYSYQPQNSDARIMAIGHDRQNFATKDVDNSVNIGSERFVIEKPLDGHVDNRNSNRHFDPKLSLTQSRNRYNEYNYSKPERKPQKKYQRQSMRLQITLDDNVARSRHETARQEAEWLQDKAVIFDKQHAQLIDSMCTLLDDLETNVHKIRELNTNIDLLEKNKLLLYELRDEIQVWADEPGVMECYDEVVRILSKPIQNNTIKTSKHTSDFEESL